MITQFLNTLFVQTQGAYLFLDHETVQVTMDNKQKLSIPLHHLGSIVVMGRVNLSSPLLARRTKVINEYQEKMKDSISTSRKITYNELKRSSWKAATSNQIHFLSGKRFLIGQESHREKLIS